MTAIAMTGAVQRSSALSLYALLIWALFSSLAAAQPEYYIQERDDGEIFLEERQNYQFTGALAIYGSGGGAVQSSGSSNENPSGAVQAQCPADHPVSCTNIQQPYYCCPSNNYCSWANSVVACCPNGQTCSGTVQGGGAATTTWWQPSTTYQQPSTTYQQPAPTTVYGGGGYVAPAGTTMYTTPQTTVGYGGYCSTLIAVGPGLPTTQAGDCGTILIAEAEAIQAAVLGWTKLITMLAGLQILGGLVFLRR